MNEEIKHAAGIEAISKKNWKPLEDAHFPFSDYEFFEALEASGAVGTGTGWMPQYVGVWDREKLLAVSFLYVKDNSYGEYIFDWAWANAYHQHRVPYYPKMVSAIPFTPATGPKFLFQSGGESDLLRSQLILEGVRLAKEKNCSSLHYLFIRKEEIPAFEKEGFLIRQSFQYHWKNNRYANFEHFLSGLKPRKRKQILRERSQFTETNVTVRWLTGDELTDAYADFFYRCYLSTIEKMGAIAYFPSDFFRRVFTNMKDRIHLLIAEENGSSIAGALLYQKGSRLYGRYWGALKEVRNLHFELCYYRPIEWAIANQIECFEAGAQGEHKIARGFEPTLTYSAHWIGHPAFREGISRFIEEEKRGISEWFDEVSDHKPFQSDNS